MTLIDSLAAPRWPASDAVHTSSTTSILSRVSERESLTALRTLAML
jgi:hypothetical protein